MLGNRDVVFDQKFQILDRLELIPLEQPWFSGGVADEILSRCTLCQ